MPQAVKYFFSKSKFYNNNTTTPVETVGVVYQYGGWSFSSQPSQDQGVARDEFNQRNILHDVREYVSRNVTKIKFPRGASVDQALDIIDKNIGDKKTKAKIDQAVRDYASVYDAWHARMEFYEAYRIVLNQLPYFTPQGIRAMVMGEKYPFSAAAHDFARGVDRKEIQKSINVLPPYLRRQLRGFCERYNYVITDDIIRDSQEFIPMAMDRLMPRRSVSVDQLIGRTADEFLRDAAKYEYFKKTGDMDIFFSKFQQMEIDSLPDNELAAKYAAASGQRFEDALVIKGRIEKLASENKDMSEFIAAVYKYSVHYTSSYCNPEIARLMFNTLKPYYNKFKSSKAVTKYGGLSHELKPYHNKFKSSKAVTQYMGLFHERVLDAKLRRDISETFGIKPESVKEKKERIKSSLRDAATRISSGDVSSDLVVVDEIEGLRNRYGVIAGPETFDKTKKLHTPTKTQQEIVKRFSGRGK